MATRHPEIFAALAAPFDREELKSRKLKPAQPNSPVLTYITARTAMNRLDEVLGPENWRDEYHETREGLKCRLSIRLEPGGEWLPKEDGGAPAGMAERDNDEKSGFSDAFKRAAAKWGVARYLYRDGVPSYEGAEPSQPPEPVPPSSKPPGTNGKPPEPVPPRAATRKAVTREQAIRNAEAIAIWKTYAEATSKAAAKAWAAEMDREGVAPEDRQELTNPSRMTHAVCSAALEGPDPPIAWDDINKADKPTVKDPARVMLAVANLYAHGPETVEEIVEAYLNRKRSELRPKLGMPDLDAEAAVLDRGREPGEDG